MRLVYTSAVTEDFLLLCRGLDDTLNELAGGEENRMEYVPLNKTDDIRGVVVAYDGDMPIGGAGFKRFDETSAEVKRMFVKPEYRGRGVAKGILALIEQKAKEAGYERLVLETGGFLIAANKLYKGIGFRVIPNYGPYVNMPESVCMEKEL